MFKHKDRVTPKNAKEEAGADVRVSRKSKVALLQDSTDLIKRASKEAAMKRMIIASWRSCMAVAFMGWKEYSDRCKLDKETERRRAAKALLPPGKIVGPNDTVTSALINDICDPLQGDIPDSAFAGNVSRYHRPPADMTQMGGSAMKAGVGTQALTWKARPEPDSLWAMEITAKNRSPLGSTWRDHVLAAQSREPRPGLVKA